MMAFFVCVFLCMCERAHQRSAHSSYAVHLVLEEHRKGRGCFTDLLLLQARMNKGMSLCLALYVCGGGSWGSKTLGFMLI